MHGPPSDGRYTFPAIRPLIAMTRTEGRDVVAVFRCTETGRAEKALWRAPPVGASAVTAQLTATSSLYAARNQVNGLVRGLLGYGALGRMARKASDVVLTGAHPQAQLSADEEEAGIVGAFRSVADRFTWDGRRWTHAGEVAQPAAGALTARLLGGPELSAYDRDVTARMVVAVARVHGGVSDEERSHLLDIFGDAGSLDALLSRPPLTDAELAETTRGAVRRNMLAVTWSMAFCDADFEPEEEALLERFASALGVSVEERVALKAAAQVHVVEQFVDRMFAWGGHDTAARAELAALANRIGMSPGQLQRAEARALKKRMT